MKEAGTIWRALVLGALASAGLAGLTRDAQAQAPTPPTPPCEVRVNPVTVPVQAEVVELSATLSEAIGETLSARVDEASGIQVVAVEVVKGAGGEAPAAHKVAVQLSTASAVAGEWALTLEGDDGRQCSGKVQVQTTGAASGRR